jgi:hypothetical protein
LIRESTLTTSGGISTICFKRSKRCVEGSILAVKILIFQ